MDVRWAPVINTVHAPCTPPPPLRATPRSQHMLCSLQQAARHPSRAATRGRASVEQEASVMAQRPIMEQPVAQGLLCCAHHEWPGALRSWRWWRMPERPTVLAAHELPLCCQPESASRAWMVVVLRSRAGDRRRQAAVRQPSSCVAAGCRATATRRPLGWLGGPPRVLC